MSNLDNLDCWEKGWEIERGKTVEVNSR